MLGGQLGARPTLAGLTPVQRDTCNPTPPQVPHSEARKLRPDQDCGGIGTLGGKGGQGAVDKARAEGVGLDVGSHQEGAGCPASVGP